MSATELYTKGARVWIPDSEVVWRGAELLENYTGQKSVKIQYEEGEESVLEIKDKTKLPHLRNPDILIGENDLTSLSYLNEPEVLYNLQVRFADRNIIYTYCGIVLVAINPYEEVNIYSNDIIQAYSGQDMGAMDPHIFAVAEEAYKHMSRFDRNESIIVSGESGAGKTVSAKYAMRYFATVGGSQAETMVEQRVLASNPIMEAIGNAKTTRNDNSSRFGKYLEITFNKQHEIVGAHMRTYLLEKSRVVFQASDERNYHVFYQLCASANRPEFKKFQLMSPDDFFYTSCGQAPEIQGVNDAENMNNTLDALTLLGVGERHQLMLLQILAGILHFGNVKITETEGECCEIPAKDKSLATCCSLLGIEESQMRMWLCHKKITTVNEVLTKPLTASQASFAQDALAKHIYAEVFTWIVNKINITLHSVTKQHKFIGVLDIYGFETFEINSFEQFCINYANEKLQQIFNSHVFKLEQEEYVREGIEWSFIDFYDNQPCIDLIESKLGILDLLDEECKMPRGSDANWCQKLYSKHLGKAKHFDKPRMSNIAFIIAHFADKVQYFADGFLEKNRDTVLEEHINILKASEFELVAELFDHKDPNLKKPRSGSAATHPTRSVPKTGAKSNRSTVGSQQQQKATVGDQFRDSLKMLMETLNATTPHYIRCIKPNDNKEAFTFEPNRAVEQLRACGVLETIRISAAGYPSRWTYNEFFQRYRVLARSKDINRSNPRQTCENILTKIIQDRDKYRFGKTKIFFRAGQVAYLEKLRSEKLRACGIMIQKHVKGWLARRRYKKIMRSIKLIQKHGRGVLARRHAKFLRETRAATKIQKTFKGFKARKTFMFKKRAVVKLQACIRGLFGRRQYQKQMHEYRAIVIQKYIRGWLQRRRYHKIIHGFVLIQSHYRRRKARAQLKVLKIEAKSVDHLKGVNIGLENKIIELQQKLDNRKKEVQQGKVKDAEIVNMKTEMEKLRQNSNMAEKSTNRITELLKLIEELQEELAKEKGEKQDLLAEKDLTHKKHAESTKMLMDENMSVKEQLDKANEQIRNQEKQSADTSKEKLDTANKIMMAEFESERAHHQRLVKDYARLQQRLENLQGEMQVLTSPQGHKRTPSEISAISLESYASSISPEDKDDFEKESDQGYDTTEKKKKKGPAPAPPFISVDTVANGTHVEKDVDIGLVLKLQSRIKDLEKDKDNLQQKVDNFEDGGSPAHRSSAVISDSAFDALKKQLVNAEDVEIVIKLQKRIRELENAKSKLVDELDEREEEDENMSFKIMTPEYAYNNLKMQELENENDKLKREVSKLVASIAETTNFDQTVELTPAGKEFLEQDLNTDRIKVLQKQFEAMTDELERRREECLQLRAMMAERSITTHEIAKQSYGGIDSIVNEDNELAMAYRTQKELNRLLENQLQKTEKEGKKKEEGYKKEIRHLKKDNDEQQKMITQRKKSHNISLSPEARIEATMQHEITRLTSENLDLRETIEKNSDQTRKLKKMLKVYARRLKDGEAAEIAAELEQDDAKASVDNVATIKHRERMYMGMLEYKKEDENVLIKNLIMDLKPKVAGGLLPGLPAYILFMCVRHTDYINDDEKVRALLTNSINSVRKCVKKHHGDLDRVTLWLANTCRLLHTLKQYSGEKAFQSDNNTRQNEHCLRNFDLSEYRQVFSDLAVWIYQTLIKLMEETIQPMIVAAVLEHEAIAGLTASKPSGMRGRSSSTATDPDNVKELSLDSLMKAMNKYSQVLTQHAVDPELVKQIFRQLYYFICAGALNNLLLRKDMCNWSKGMQIRYNLSHLEQWLRDNKLHEVGAQVTMEPIIQASQLLQARKTVADVDSICEMCSKLTTAQIVKILNLYTPVDEFEERVPIPFIREIQKKLKNRPQESDNTLLMDTKFSYPVTFPFNPSSITMETVEVPQSLHLGFLTRV
ncbi:unconventional myosin-Va-like isoform X3 [Mizuhopecten yessoensis]|uniref:unconventional myosin-Va-like isoform X3 n=1 Tax=Mizuhopecten yessoensis TaxID=6573 RepID=UPI000B45D9F1|nr:unconventional myosin-Va-like isoform X3 [Mizuhopecten yessoensis]